MWVGPNCACLSGMATSSTLDFRLVVQKLQREFTHAQDFDSKLPLEVANSCRQPIERKKLYVLHSHMHANGT